MAAAAINAGVESKATADNPVESQPFADTELYQHSNEAMQEIFDKLDSGEYHIVPDATSAPVDCPAEAVMSMAGQDLRLYEEGKIATIRDSAQGDSLAWNVAIFDRENKLVMETDSVVLSRDGKALVVRLENSDYSHDIARFVDGKIESNNHFPPHHTMEDLKAQEAFQQAPPDVQRLQQNIVAGVEIVGKDKEPVSVEVSEDIHRRMVEQGIHLNKRGTRIEPDLPGQGDTLSWEAEYKDAKTKAVVRETQSVDIAPDGRALVVSIRFSDGSADRVRFENGKIVSKDHSGPAAP